MKTALFTILLTLCSCVAKKERVVIERVGVVNLDSWQRLPWEYAPPVEIEIDYSGVPACSKLVMDSLRAPSVLWKEIEKRKKKEIEKRKKEDPNFDENELDDKGRASILAEKEIPETISLERIRWQIHPFAPVEKVAMLTGRFGGTQRLEFWTAKGIFIVGAPNYAGRRLPMFGERSIELDYRVSPNGSITRNKKPWSESTDRSQSARWILEDLDRHKSTGFQNIYFEFQPSSQWSAVVEVMGEILPKLGGLRGMSFFEEKKGVLVLHFHDVWFNWKNQERSAQDHSSQPDQMIPSVKPLKQKQEKTEQSRSSLGSEDW